MKIVPNVIFRSCAARFGQIAFLSVKVLKIVTLVLNFVQYGKTVRFSWKLYKTVFFGHAQHVLPNRIFERQSSQNRYTCLKFSSIRENSALFIKIVQTFFSGHAQHVLAKSHLWASKFSKSSHWPQILFKLGKQCAFHENCTKRSFQVMRSTFWPNRIFERQSSQNRHTGLKFSSNQENSVLSIKARFGQIALVSVKVFKIVTLVSNSLQKVKTVRFS